MPLYLSQLLLKLQQHYHYLVEQIKDLESQLKRKLDEDEVGQRLLSIPCVGTLTASTISTEIGDGKQYASSRDFAAATGLDTSTVTAREVGRHCWELVSEVTKDPNFVGSMCRVFIQKLEHQSEQIGRLGQGSTVSGKATLSSLVLWQTSCPNSTGPNGTTTNLCNITAKCSFKESLMIWFCEY